jgi:uncharacterized protein (TIGR02265 family)
MSEAPVVFSSGYESLRRLLGDRLDADFTAKLKAQGVDLSALNPAYPYETWVQSLELTMAKLWPGVPRAEATYNLGREMFDSFGHTLLGKALLQMLRVLGPNRGLQRMTRNLRTSNNYSDTKLTQKGPTAWELWINLVAFPHYYRGLVECGLQHSGAKNVQVEILTHTPNGAAVLLIAWT